MTVKTVVSTGTAIPWIDVCKGIGIAAIVFGHALPEAAATTRFLFLFHVPLFFFLSGYLHKRQADFASYLKKKAAHLLLPYVAFLICLAPIEYISQARHGGTFLQTTGKLLWGGPEMPGVFAIFWFVTCLFLTQQVMNILIVKLSTRSLVSVVVGFFCGAYLLAYYFPRFNLPGDGNVVLGAAPFFLAGYFYRKLRSTTTITMFSAPLVLTSFVLIGMGVRISYNMRNSDYGIPIVSFVLSLACIAGIFWLSQALSSLPLVARVLSSVGAASMGIMYVHELFITRLKALNGWALGVIALTGSYALVKLMERFSFTRKVFLGASTPRLAVHNRADIPMPLREQAPAPFVQR
jgi:polysaccharide biosynthesis protein PslL